VVDPFDPFGCAQGRLSSGQVFVGPGWFVNMDNTGNIGCVRRWKNWDKIGLKWIEIENN